MRREAEKMGSKILKNAKIIISTSDDPVEWKQQGGTCIGLVTGMVRRKMSGGEDNKGLGRSSYVQIAGKEQKKVMFVTAYKPCVQTNEGESTVTAHHKQILTMQRDTNASLRK
eukprot:6840105-Ditylum_brightwellii.AAC.1